MPAPPPIPDYVSTARIIPRQRDPYKNVCKIALQGGQPGIRRAYLVLQMGTMTYTEWNRTPWTLSADVYLAEPFNNLEHVTLAPSLLDISPLAAPVMHVATAFWPDGLPAKSIHIRVSSSGEEPSGDACVYGWGDATPHDRAGLWPTPYGYVRQPDRLVEPLPDPNQTLANTPLVDFLQWVGLLAGPLRRPRAR
jgi:hypothetical protein